MEDQILERIRLQLNKATRPCEVGLVVAIVGLPESRAALLPERLTNYIKNRPPELDLPFQEKIHLIPYFRQGKIKLSAGAVSP